MFFRKRFRILLEFDEKPKSWKDAKIYLTYMGWYKAQKFFKEKGIIVEDGVDKRGRKLWKLTDKGKRLVELLKEIEGLLR